MPDPIKKDPTVYAGIEPSFPASCLAVPLQRTMNHRVAISNLRQKFLDNEKSFEQTCSQFPKEVLQLEKSEKLWVEKRETFKSRLNELSKTGRFTKSMKDWLIAGVDTNMPALYREKIFNQVARTIQNPDFIKLCKFYPQAELNLFKASVTHENPTELFKFTLNAMRKLEKAVPNFSSSFNDADKAGIVGKIATFPSENVLNDFISAFKDMGKSFHGLDQRVKTGFISQIVEHLGPADGVIDLIKPTVDTSGSIEDLKGFDATKFTEAETKNITSRILARAQRLPVIQYFNQLSQSKNIGLLDPIDRSELISLYRIPGFKIDNREVASLPIVSKVVSSDAFAKLEASERSSIIKVLAAVSILSDRKGLENVLDVRLLDNLGKSVKITPEQLKITFLTDLKLKNANYVGKQFAAMITNFQYFDVTYRELKREEFLYKFHPQGKEEAAVKIQLEFEGAHKLTIIAPKKEAKGKTLLPTLDALITTLGNLPVEDRDQIDLIVARPHERFFKRQDGKISNAFMTSDGQRAYSVYKSSRAGSDLLYLLMTLIHEVGHEISLRPPVDNDKRKGGLTDADWSRWEKAMEKDLATTTGYGHMQGPKEDLPEAYAISKIVSKHPDNVRLSRIADAIYKNRRALLREWGWLS